MKSSSKVLNKYQEIIGLDNSQFVDFGKKIAIPEFSKNRIINVCKEALSVLKSQETLLRIDENLTIVGNLNGNLFDLIRLLKISGNQKILFLGNFVSDGGYPLETATLILSLLALGKCYVIRGPNEFQETNKGFSFYKDILGMYGTKNLWEKFNSVFSYLPLAAIVNNSVFCVCGGLSPSVKSIPQISNIKRTVHSCKGNTLIHDLLFSKPTTSFFQMNQKGNEESVMFSKDDVETFLRENDIKAIVRSSQPSKYGVTKQFCGSLFSVSSSCTEKDGITTRCGVVKVDNSINGFSLPLFIGPKRTAAKLA
ncbi:Ser/Thr protein phosphatase [Histomonas meleagridis]|uniref:Ser/Thr protein phosphatase n=1 Tax=Histomonas meleagridis TaxID=135588 RepID=UPI00355ACCB2|nr:Ser/Thr protein phosphatase [Histomonas meleagridis]KAH0801632.1 Ser/Thr protein phosphatase [Histomonas meleagridis]